MKNEFLKSRRRFLESILAAGAAAPFAGLLARPALAATNIKRVMFVYLSDGCIPERWHPSGSEFNFTIPEMTSPLASVKDKLVFLKGLNMYEGGATHEGGIRKVLTGNGDTSLDVYLGKNMAASTPFSSLQLGVCTNFQSTQGGGSYINGSRITTEDNPLNAFNRIFAGANPDSENNDSRKGSILDTALADLNTIRGKLGNTEKVKLDTHLESLREVEKRVKSTSGSCDVSGFNPTGFSVSPTDYYPKTYHLEKHYETVGKMQMDLSLMAFACGMTNVISLAWSHPVTATRVTVNGKSINGHDASHYGSPDSGGAGDFIAIKQWHLERYKYLIEELASRPEGDGSMLDHTLILTISDLGDGNRHDHKNMPFVLAGGQALGVQGGRMLDFNGDAHTKMLVSVANLMGVNINQFGYTGHGTGGLEGLI